MLFDDGLNYRSVFLQVGIYIFYIDFSHGIDRWLGLSMQPLHGRCTDRNALQALTMRLRTEFS